MLRRWRCFAWFCALGLLASDRSATADQLEQLDGPMLVGMIKGSDVTARPILTTAELGGMPAWLRDSRAALVVMKTDLGNPARLLLAVELRKPAGGQGEPIPVVVVERLDTFDSAEPTTRLSSRKDVMLFDGFQLDLDTGQVVPEGQGGDIALRIRGEGPPRLEPIGGAKLFTLNQAPTFDDAKVPRPTPGRAVVPRDFAGRYRLFANGQWSGTLDLQVGARGVINGRFRSDLHGTAYPVTGQAAVDVPQKLQFAISFPRARQEFEGYLWGEGKGAMAGTASLLDRPSGFFAVREGGRYAPEGRDIGPLAKADDDRPGRHDVEIRGERLTYDGKLATLAEVGTRLKSLGETESEAWVLVRASPEEKYKEIRKIIQIIKDAGINTIRIDQIKD